MRQRPSEHHRGFEFSVLDPTPNDLTSLASAGDDLVAHDPPGSLDRVALAHHLPSNLRGNRTLDDSLGALRERRCSFVQFLSEQTVEIGIVLYSH